ncbi:MAG: DUF4174 domain-containing protein [Rhodobacter sp.]|jgi:hypothetical protein|nr:DUF4174 domain-containing protein [Rhodobacter sp.]
MKLLHILVLSCFLPLAAAAQDTPAPSFGPIDAAGVTLNDFLWLKRPIVVFADTPNDPAFQRQMQRINADLAPLEERDVVIITDTDPAARTEVRQRLRPRGFSLVLMDKDGEVKRRNPAPWGVRDITHAIDRFPLRRQEMLEQRPSGR